MDRLPDGLVKPAPSTALDFLIAELLGDVGKVDAAVRSLRDRLDGTEERIREAGTAAADALMDATLSAIAEMGRRAAFEESRRVQAARVEAADLRGAFMVAAKQTLNDLRAAKLGRTSRTVAVICVIAAMSSLAGAVLGYALAHGWMAQAIVNLILPL